MRGRGINRYGKVMEKNIKVLQNFRLARRKR
jgi:hypothetical protein